MTWINRNTKKPEIGQQVVALIEYFGVTGELRRVAFLSVYDYTTIGWYPDPKNRRTSKYPGFLALSAMDISLKDRHEQFESYITHWAPMDNLPPRPPLSSWLKKHPAYVDSVVASIGSILEEE